MEKILFLLFIVINTSLIYSQDYLQEGDKCFDKGDYSCAIFNYDKGIQSYSGKEKQISELKLNRAKTCNDALKEADSFYNKKDYEKATNSYQKVLSSNPKDEYSVKQKAKCDEEIRISKLRKATEKELQNIRKGDYGKSSLEQRNKLITLGINPDDAFRRINLGEGKLATTLSVSHTSLEYDYKSGISTDIRVNTNAGSYTIDTRYLANWIEIKKYHNYFQIIYKENNWSVDRGEFFYVNAGDKQVRIDIKQFKKAQAKSRNSESSKKSQQQTTKKNNKHFNYRKDNYTNWGIMVGYTEHYPGNVAGSGYLVGIKYEPQFKYGFGVNLGLNYERVKNISYEDIYMPYAKYNFMGDNISLNTAIEYRLNISKWFTPFIYSGMTFNYNINESDDYEYYNDFMMFIDLGVGVRIGRVQLDMTNSMLLDNVRYGFDFGEFYQIPDKLSFRMSVMF